MKKLMTFIVTIFIFSTLFSTASFGAEKSATSSYAISIESYDLKIQGTSSKFISSSMCSINVLGNGILEITASTKMNTIVDYSNIDIFLEIYNQDHWEIVKIWNETDYYSDSTYFEIPYVNAIDGEKYRVQTEHTVRKDGVTDTAERCTKYVVAE